MYLSENSKLFNPTRELQRVCSARTCPVLSTKKSCCCGGGEADVGGGEADVGGGEADVGGAVDGD